MIEPASALRPTHQHLAVIAFPLWSSASMFASTSSRVSTSTHRTSTVSCEVKQSSNSYEYSTSRSMLNHLSIVNQRRVPNCQLSPNMPRTPRVPLTARKELSTQLRAQIIGAYRTGGSMRNVAASLHVSFSNVRFTVKQILGLEVEVVG